MNIVYLALIWLLVIVLVVLITIISENANRLKEGIKKKVLKWFSDIPTTLKRLHSVANGKKRKFAFTSIETDFLSGT